MGSSIVQQYAYSPATVVGPDPPNW